MIREYKFDDKAAFLHQLEELVRSGVHPRRLTVTTPFHVHEVEHILHLRPSWLKLFTLFGAAAGLTAGFAFTIGTALDWPLRTGGKPIVALPTYIIVAFELTILLGGVISFLGFLFLSRFPDISAIVSGAECGSGFIIREDTGEAV